MINPKLIIALLVDKFGCLEDRREPSRDEKAVLDVIDDAKMAEVDNPNLIKVILKSDEPLPPSPISELQYTADGKLDGCADDINIYASNPESASDGTASEHSSDGECSDSSRSSRSRSSSYYSSSGDERSEKNSRGKRPPSPKGSPRPAKRVSPPPRKPSPTGSDSRKRKASPSPSKPPDSGNNLPRVSAQLKERLLDHSAHIDMADLLPGNSARGRGDDSSNKGFNNSRREPIASFALWTRAYSVFMAYRTYNHPELVIPMLKYLDLIGLYADPGKGYRLEQWLDYDHYFRRYATSHPEDPSIWAVRHEESYLRCMAAGNDRQSVAPPSVTISNGYREPAASGYHREPASYNREANGHNRESGSYNREANGYNRESTVYNREPNGYNRETNGYNGYREAPPIVIKPRDVEVCLRFNRGNCTTPCIRKRSHVCMKCGGAGHGKYICNKGANPAFGRGRNMR